MSNNEKAENKGFLAWVERVGNKIPHPFILFLWLIVIVAVLSFVLNLLNVSAINPTTSEEVAVKNLLSGEGINHALTSMVRNFTGFAPLGLILTMTLGLGLAEEVGFMSSLMRKTMLGAPTRVVTFVIALIGICGNIASDAAIVIIPPLAAMIFMSLGRNPIAGIAIGYAATTGGFSANLLPAGTDALLQGITNEASAIVGAPEIPLMANWYIMIVSTFILAFVISIMSERYLEPKLGKYTGNKQIKAQELTPEENAGLRASGIATLIYVVLLVIALVPKNSFLRHPETGEILTGSPFMSGIIPILLILFLVSSIPYAIKLGKIKSSADIPKLMTKATNTMSGFIVLAFIIGQFISYFNWTNLGQVLAIGGSNVLSDIGFTGPGLFIGYILLCAFVNLFIGSGSAKWALLAPIFVPMFALLNYHPAWTQFLYRMGDSSTNIISPLFTYFPIILAYMNEYDEEAGVGTLLSLMIPYSAVILIAWIILGFIWYFTGWPLGPGGFIFM
ncbi:MAG: AbgT family transporter [Tissierella sp.]|nr:AbgT family transporter [Tissierella sp.]